MAEMAEVGRLGEFVTYTQKIMFSLIKQFLKGIQKLHISCRSGMYMHCLSEPSLYQM